MKKILLILFIGIFLISSISALDDIQLPQSCGGDSELIIGCLGDSELTFLAGLAPEEFRGGAGVFLGVEQTITDKEEIPPEKLAEPSLLFSIASFFGIRGEDIILFEAIIILILSLALFIFVKKRKKKKEEKRIEERNMERDENRKL